MSQLSIVAFALFLSASAFAAPQPFGASRKGCFLLFDVRKNAFVKEIGGETCRERFPACSTFKVPLAAMAFDAGILKDERVVLKWDGKKEAREEANRDHDARSWMRDSIVWFSQRLATHLGQKRFRKYLREFKYGNENISGGITEAWLLSPNESKKALAVSSYEQVDFMKKLWNGKLPVSERAARMTRDITYLETSPKGYALHGKTGSNFYDKERAMHLGWFVAHLQKGDEEFVAVVAISDLKPSEEKGYGGFKAKAVMKALLTEQGLW